MSSQTTRVTALILAGGRGSRLNNEDKGLLDVAGKPLLGHVIERIRPQVQGLMVSANRNLQKYRQFTDTVVSDDPAIGEHYAGPLAGILAGLEHAGTELLLVIPCDMPCLPDTLTERLLTGINAKTTIAVAHDGIRTQQLVMLLDRRLAANLREWLLKGGRAVRDWLATHEHAVVRFNRSELFNNLNTAEDVALFVQNGCMELP